MEQIKSPKTNRLIYINGDTYKSLIKDGYQEQDLLSLPRYTKPTSPKVKSVKKSIIKTPNISELSMDMLNNDVILQLALRLNYYEIVNLCNINSQYLKLCQNQYFWKLKFYRDFGEFTRDIYDKNKKSYDDLYEVNSYEEYINERLKIAHQNWRILYQNVFYEKIEKIVLNIFHRFGIRQKYDRRYEQRKDDIFDLITTYLENPIKSKQNNMKVVEDIKKVLGQDYADFNYYARFFEEEPEDKDTPEQFLLKMAQSEM